MSQMAEAAQRPRPGARQLHCCNVNSTIQHTHTNTTYGCYTATLRCGLCMCAVCAVCGLFEIRDRSTTTTYRGADEEPWATDY
eukprot:scaffold14068_cov119-Isochrysis_galbana.AAC.22